VDLDGAREGRPVNGESIRRIIAESNVPCQLGGGLRDQSHVREALDWGVSRVIVGTRALDEPAWLEALAGRHPGQVVLGLDARHGRLASEGWSRFSDRAPLDAARQFAALPLAAILYTDIGRDGMLAGPNLLALSELLSAVAMPIIASGGVSTREDVQHLARLGVAGCVIGRALYEGKLQLKDVIQAAGTQSLAALVDAGHTAGVQSPTSPHPSALQP
jgi:phosphoribosylformimino-5-aminoimidazole carboxamide ribotide isomerase